jgi:hypothetical protein
MFDKIVVQGLFDVFSPEEAIKKLVDAVLGIFGSSASKSLTKALKEIASFTPIDQDGRYFTEVYDGAYAFSLIFGGLASLLWLYRAVRLEEVESLWNALKSILTVFIVGAFLPHAAYVFTNQLNDFNAGLVEFFTGKPVEDNAFKIGIPDALNFVDGAMAWVAGIVLQLEGKILVFYLPFVMTLLLLTLGLRWLGMLGDAFFVFMMGVMFVVLFGRTAIIGIVGFMVLMPQKYGYDPSMTIIAFSTLLAACAPIAMLVLYYVTNLSRKMHGVMDSRSLSNRITSKESSGSSASSRWSQRLYQAGAGAAAGAVIARASGNGRPDGVSRLDNLRSSGSAALAAKGMSALATKHPVTAVAYITGSKLLKRPDKSD